MSATDKLSSRDLRSVVDTGLQPGAVLTDRNVIPFPDLDEEWVELVRPDSVKARADVSLRLSRQPRTGRVSAYLSFRGEAARHLKTFGPLHRVLIGGPDADRVKLVPDRRAGRYRAVELRNFVRLHLGVVTAWPAEMRDPVACAWSFDPATMALMIQLPAGFTRPTAPTPRRPPLPASAVPVPPTPLLASVVAERDELAERLRQIEEQQTAGLDRIPDWVGDARLTQAERRLLDLLLRRDLVTREAILLATADDVDDDERDSKIVDVFICKLRPKLAAVGVYVLTHRDEGYSIPAAQRSALKQEFGITGVAA